MKGIFFFGIIILIALFIAILFWYSRRDMETVEVCFRGNCFTAEVAKDPSQRSQGLMFRRSLGEKKAMLFVFSAQGGSASGGEHSFWMKNCLISLDIIWLDEDYKVVAIRPNNKPCPAQGASPEQFDKLTASSAEGCPSINPDVLAQYVLEINAGLASKMGLKEGDYFSIQTLLTNIEL